MDDNSTLSAEEQIGATKDEFVAVINAVGKQEMHFAAIIVDACQSEFSPKQRTQLRAAVEFSFIISTATAPL